MISSVAAVWLAVCRWKAESFAFQTMCQLRRSRMCWMQWRLRHNLNISNEASDR